MTEENKWVEESFAWIYYSDFAWILGYLIQFSLGLAVYSIISMDAFFLFFEAAENDEVGAYLLGPFRRSLSGWTIFWINVVLTLIPGVNFVAPFIMFEWAKADYYDYYTQMYVA